MALSKYFFTVFTPSYNRAHTLERLFNSIKSQTFKDFEWVIIDDGSTDNTKELVNHFKTLADFSIVYQYQENKHKHLATKAAVDIAQGKFFYIIDSDDELLPNALETIHKSYNDTPSKFQKNILGIVGLCIDENNNIMGTKYPKEEIYTSIFEMRLNHRVTGEKSGVTLTEVLKRIDWSEDKFEGKGFISESYYQNQFDSFNMYTKFINKSLRIYHKDENDEISLDTNFYDKKNYFGLYWSYQMYLKTYAQKLLSQPKDILKKYFRVVQFGKGIQKNFFQIFKDIEGFEAQLIYIILSPFLFTFYLIK